MRRREDLGKASGKLARSVFIALLSMLSWVALPSAAFAFHGPHGFGGRPQGGGARLSNWGGHYAGVRPYSGYPPNAGRQPYVRAIASEQPHRGQQARPPYQGGHAQAQPAYRPPSGPPSGQGSRPNYRPNYQVGPGNGVGRPPYRGNSGNQLHLPGWIQQHQNMPLADQQQALRNEPGFKELPPESQQRVMQTLGKIESMPPQQRQRTLGQIEAMERLSPQERQQVRGSLRGIQMLPPDRQRMVRTALRDLIGYPPQQREAIMASRQFQNQFSPQERIMLGNVLAVEPYEAHTGPPADQPYQSGK